MARGVALDPWQIEAIEEAWILTGNATIGARAAGCGVRTAQAHIKHNLERLRAVRAEKAPAHLDVLQVVLQHLLSGLADPKKIEQARLGEVATATGIVLDKIQLISGQATARTETMAADPGRLTPEEREQARRLRAKLLGEESSPLQGRGVSGEGSS